MYIKDHKNQEFNFLSLRNVFWNVWVILPIPVKNWLLISLREVCLRSKFGKHSSSLRRNMTDKQNHMIKSILRHQHLRRLVLRLLPREVFPIWVSWLPLLEKSPQVLLAFIKFLQQSILSDLLFHCFSEDSCFETSSMVETKFFSIFFLILCRQRYLIFL